MILFFKKDNTIFAVQTTVQFSEEELSRLQWLLGGADHIDTESISGIFIGPRREMITPWSTNAVEITQNMGLQGIIRIEEFVETDNEDTPFDPMLRRKYHTIDQDVYTISKQPDPIVYIDDMVAYNKQEGLALSEDEIAYLEELSRRLGRKLTDSEVFGFSPPATACSRTTRHSTA